MFHGWLDSPGWPLDATKVSHKIVVSTEMRKTFLVALTDRKKNFSISSHPLIVLGTVSLVCAAKRNWTRRRWGGGWGGKMNRNIFICIISLTFLFISFSSFRFMMLEFFFLHLKLSNMEALNCLHTHHLTFSLLLLFLCFFHERKREEGEEKKEKRI